MTVTGYLSFVIELSYTFQCLRDYYIITGSSLNILRAYFVLSLNVMQIVTSKLIKDKYNVVRFYYYDIHYFTSYTSVTVLLACCLSKE